MTIVALSVPAPSAVAGDAGRGIANIFKHNKLMVEEKHCRITRIEQGYVMETKDGQRITIVRDEVERLDSRLKDKHAEN